MAKTTPKNWNLVLVLDKETAAVFNNSEGLFDKVYVADFFRGLNLTGEAAIFGVANTLVELSKGSDIIIKQDSDSLIFDHSQWEKDGFCGITEPKVPTSSYGIAYTMPSRIIEGVPECIRGWLRKGWVPYGEDTAITSAGLVLGASDYRQPIVNAYQERYDGRTANRQYTVGHYRSRLNARKAKANTEQKLSALTASCMLRDALGLGLIKRGLT